MRLLTCTLPVQTRLLFDLSQPSRLPAPLLIAFHQYGSNRGRMLELARQFTPSTFAIISVQGPHQHTRLSHRTGLIVSGYGWGTLENRDLATQTHRQIIRKVTRWAVSEGLTNEDRIALAAFSEAVPLNYEYAAANPQNLIGLVAFCGEVPTLDNVTMLPPIFHFAGADDPVVPFSQPAARFSALSRVSKNARFEVYDAGHEITREMMKDARSWLRSLTLTK